MVMIDQLTVDELRKITHSILDDNGNEIPNPEPMFIEEKPKRRTIAEQVKRIVRQEISKNAMYQGFETWEEANDFEVEEDPPILAPDQIKMMQDEIPLEMAQESQSDKIAKAHSEPIDAEVVKSEVEDEKVKAEPEEPQSGKNSE